MNVFSLLVYLLNFFYLDRDLKKCAKYHGDTHLNKMQVEYAQIASTVWWKLVKKHDHLKEHFEKNIKPKIYRSTHENHPVVLWATQSESHLLAVVQLGLELAEEKKVRASVAKTFGKSWKVDHASTPILQFIKDNLPPIEAFELADEWRDPPACMPELYINLGVDIIDRYRFFYVDVKVIELGIKWEPYAEDPPFVQEYQERIKIEIEKLATNDFNEEEMDVLYKGDKKCEAKFKSGAKKGQKCDNNAYYLQNGQALCGIHSDKKLRTELKENPKKKEIAAEANVSREDEVIAAAAENIEKGLPGQVCCRKLKMMGAAPHVQGFQSIFPNFKHGGRTDGVGLPSLSPMSLGPVLDAGDLPEATNLENWWQGQKLYEEEVGKDGKPLPVFYERRKAMFEDPVPHRRKEGMNSNVKCFLWTNNEGYEVEYTYIPSRQFYCTLFERLSEENEDLATLRQLRRDGMNLNIIGYDGFDFEKAKGETPAEKLMSCYLDPSRPFGHELVIVSLLLLKREEYPWVIRKTADF